MFTFRVTLPCVAAKSPVIFSIRSKRPALLRDSSSHMTSNVIVWSDRQDLPNLYRSCCCRWLVIVSSSQRVPFPGRTGVCACVCAFTGLLVEMGGVQVGDELLQALLVAVHLPVSSHEEPPRRHGGAAGSWYLKRGAAAAGASGWGGQFWFRSWAKPAGCQVASELAEGNGRGASRGPRLLLCLWIRQMRRESVALCYHLLVKVMNCDE